MYGVGKKPSLPKVSAPHNGPVCIVDTQSPSEFSQASISREYIHGQEDVQTCA